MPAADLATRLRRRTKIAGECIEWTGAVQSKGYGSIGDSSGSSKLAHRVAWELANGPIPHGLTIDHLCMNKLCVNVAHLEVVTRAENIRRRYRDQTHCKYGHPLPTERDKTGRRRCKPCRREWAAAHNIAA